MALDIKTKEHISRFFQFTYRCFEPSKWRLAVEKWRTQLLFPLYSREYKYHNLLQGHNKSFENHNEH